MGRFSPLLGHLPPGLAALVLAAAGLAPAHALERSIAPAPSPHGDSGWRGSTQVTLSYYNLCTGWTWIWGYTFRSNDSYGFDAPPGTSTLVGHWEFTAWDVWTRGYSGSLAVREVTEDGQVGTFLASQPYYPTAGWTWYPWDVPVPESGRILVSARGPFYGSFRPGLVTEHTGVGPDGAGPACGTCYPSGRETRSRYSLSSSIPWPGSPFNSGDACDAELVWDAVFTPNATDVGEGVRSTTWSRLRSMFR